MKLFQVDSIAPTACPPVLHPSMLVGAKPEPRRERQPKPQPDYSPFDIFQWLTTEAQAAFTLASRRRHYADGCQVYAQSEPGNEMFRIVSGTVRKSVLRHDGREVLYLVLEPGDCFGTSSLLDGAPRCQTTNASGEVELQVLRREAWDRLRVQHASFDEALIRIISRHMRLLSEYFVSSTLDELPCRVAQRLLKAPKSGALKALGSSLTVFLSQSEIALMVGASRQAVNRVLQKFQDDGLISIEYGRVLVHDVERLRAVTFATNPQT